MKLRESQMKATFLSLRLSLQTSWQFFSFCHNANSITNYWTQKVGSGKIHSQIEGCSKYLNCALWLVQTCVIRCVKRIRIDNFLIRCVLCTLLKRASPLHFTRLVWTGLDPTWQYCLQYFFFLMGQSRPLFRLFSVFFKQKLLQFLQQINVKNVMSIQYTAPGSEPTTLGSWASSHNH